MPKQKRRAHDIDVVVDRMQTIDAALPAGDGVGWFNRMYLQVTLAVHDATVGTVFENDEFLTRLDVQFSALFFDAYDADLRREAVPTAWAPLFQHRHRPRTHPIQFALAGMNAHINHDLPLAVVSTCRDLGLRPQPGTPEHRDFTRTNEVLAATSGGLKEWFAAGIVGTVDDVAGRVDDAMAMWCIEEARAVAWGVAETLWCLEDIRGPRNLFLGALAHSVNLASRGILI